MSEQEQKKEEEKKEEGPTMKSVLDKCESKPSDEQVEQWKAAHGDVFVSGFSEDELFIWRAITRPEWVKLQELVSDPERGVDQFKFEEIICETCTLWRSTTHPWHQGKGGTASSLQEQILQNSNFLSPQAAGLLVQKL